MSRHHFMGGHLGGHLGGRMGGRRTGGAGAADRGRARLGAGLAFVLASAAACGSGTAGEDDGGEQGTPGTVTLLADVDANYFCDMPEVVDLVIRAVRVGCEPGPPAPCTLPAVPEAIEGDVATCPVTDPSRLMGVEITEVGRYQIEIVGRFTTGESTTACVHAAGGEPEVVVTRADLDAAATLELEATRDPCP